MYESMFLLHLSLGLTASFPQPGTLPSIKTMPFSSFAQNLLLKESLSKNRNVRKLILETK
jgi:hypothetical protein